MRIILDCIGNADEFTRVVLEDAKTFKPIGEKVHEYSREGDQGEDEHFEIYKVRSFLLGCLHMLIGICVIGIIQ